MGLFLVIECVWKCGYDYFLKCFLFENVSKKLFLISAHQNNLKTPKKYLFEVKKIKKLIFFKNIFRRQK
jgi:hypothetical protein